MRGLAMAFVVMSLLAPWSTGARADSTAMCKARDALCSCALGVIQADFASPGYGEQMSDGRVRDYLATLLGDPAIQRRCRAVALHAPTPLRADVGASPDGRVR